MFFLFNTSLLCPSWHSHLWLARIVANLHLSKFGHILQICSFGLLRIYGQICWIAFSVPKFYGRYVIPKENLNVMLIKYDGKIIWNSLTLNIDVNTPGGGHTPLWFVTTRDNGVFNGGGYLWTSQYFSPPYL